MAQRNRKVKGWAARVVLVLAVLAAGLFAGGVAVLRALGIQP